MLPARAETRCARARRPPPPLPPLSLWCRCDVCTITPQLAEEVEALEADNGKLEHQISHLKKALAAEPAA